MKRPGELVRWLGRLWPYARPWRRSLAAAAVATAIGAAVPLAIPYLLGVIFDQVILQEHTGEEWRLAGLFSGAALLLTLEAVSAVAEYVRSQSSRILGARLGHSLRVELYGRILRLDRATRESVAEGQFLSRLQEDTATVEQVFYLGLSALVLAPFTFAGMAAILFWLDWRMAVVACLPLPLLGIVTGVMVWTLRRKTPVAKDRAAELLALATERLGAITLIQLHAREPEEALRFREAGEAACRARLDQERITALGLPLLSFIAFAGIVAVIAFGGHAAIEGGGVSPGTLIAFVAYLAWFYAPLAEISRANFYLQNAAIACERIFTWVDRSPTIADPPDAAPIGTPAGRVTLDEVSFRYPEAGAPALDRVTLRIEPGERVAILGPSGSGKSTLLRLLVRLDDPASGIVRLDGRDLRTLRLADLRRTVALVPQEDVCLNETLAANIALGVPTAAPAEVAWAAGLAGVDLVASRHPDGLNAVVGERGVRLSGGERQRVGLARAALRRPAVLLLDEPTSALDVASEQAILQALFAALQGTTIVVVSHRPTVQSLVGRVVRMEGGRLGD
ncbi:MAG: ABC transporter ATP-binding protein [Planctomycetes bacterium]|nr:ABC transporter ATP-binding protein [Planctomycetota bacterium]